MENADYEKALNQILVDKTKHELNQNLMRFSVAKFVEMSDCVGYSEEQRLKIIETIREGGKDKFYKILQYTEFCVFAQKTLLNLSNTGKGDQGDVTTLDLFDLIPDKPYTNMIVEVSDDFTEIKIKALHKFCF